MAHTRPLLRQWPIIQRHCSFNPTLLRLFSSLLPPQTHFSFTPQKPQQLSSSTSPFTVGIRYYGLRLPDASLPEELQETKKDAEKISRNQKKRDARRAVRWGMELANFSTPQIKRIMRVASLEREVFDALMLVKRMGPDVREGKRRQFNYIGRLLRNVEPELMDALIQASKDGDNTKLLALSGHETWAIEEDEGDGEETESDEDYEVSETYINIATRWFDGLIDNDLSITKEIYAIHTVEFDRQELRKLVQRVQSIQERQLDNEKGGKTDTLIGAKKSLTRFLRTLAKQTLASDQI